MISQLLAFVSLNYFLVSPRRKIRLVAMLLLLVAAFYVPEFLGMGYYPIVSELLKLAVVFLATSSIITILRFTIVTAYRRRYGLKPGKYDNVIRSVDSTASVIVFLITTGSIFTIFGIPFQSFLTSLGLVAVGLAIMLRDYAKNFIDGFRILYTRDFLIGDYVKTKNGPAGVITDISFRATKIKTEDGDIAFIPNSSLMNGETVNYSKDKHTVTAEFTVDIKKVTDFGELETKIVERLQTDDLKDEHAQKVRFYVTKLEKDSADLSVDITLPNYSFRREAKLKNAIYRTVLEYVREQKGEEKEESEEN